MHCKLALKEIALLRKTGVDVFFRPWRCQVRLIIQLDVVVIILGRAQSIAVQGTRLSADVENCEVSPNIDVSVFLVAMRSTLCCALGCDVVCKLLCTCRMTGCRNCFYQKNAKINFDMRQVYGKRSMADGLYAAKVMAQLDQNAADLENHPEMTPRQKQALWRASFALAQSVQDRSFRLRLVNFIVNPGFHYLFCDCFVDFRINLKTSYQDRLEG